MHVPQRVALTATFLVCVTSVACMSPEEPIYRAAYAYHRVSTGAMDADAMSHGHDLPESAADLTSQHPDGARDFDGDGADGTATVPPDISDGDEGPTPHTRYGFGEIHSPITQGLRQRLLEIRSRDPLLNEELFMKVGASGTVSSSFLSCFSGSAVDWELADDGLEATRDHFLSATPEDIDPFSRKTLAAKVGMSAGWAISGDPSPLQQEFDALNPRFALVAYGTNDMQLGTTFQSAMWGFADNLQTLVDRLVSWGVVPIVQTNGPRLDNPEADRFVETYNTIIRAVAQSRQIPLLDMWLAMKDVPNWGKSGDGLHLNTSPQGACMFTEDGLAYGYNNRNLRTLEALHRSLRATTTDLTFDVASPPLAGNGSPTAPFVIDDLPFAHHGDTRMSAWSVQDAYPQCDSTSNQGGPETYYTLVLNASKRVRFMVHDQDDVDVDLHLFAGDSTQGACMMRAHQLIETTLPAGTYTLVVDSWVDAQSVVRDGPYLIAALECHPDDSSCD